MISCRFAMRVMTSIMPRSVSAHPMNNRRFLFMATLFFYNKVRSGHIGKRPNLHPLPPEKVLNRLGLPGEDAIIVGNEYPPRYDFRVEILECRNGRLIGIGVKV